MAWCFSTRASVATVLTMHPCVSRCLRVNISLKVVSMGLIDNIPALVQIMAWRLSGGKPESEPMMDSLLTHICVTRPQ